MGWTKRGAGIPLRDRVRPQGDAGGESDGVDGSAPRRGDQEPCPARHCWVHDPRGDDGVVRTTAEHAAWKGGDAEAGSGPAVTQGTGAEQAAADGVSARRELPEQESTPSAGQSGEQSAQRASSSAAEAPSGADDDSTPRPGETRREWRARTGR